MKFDMIEVIEKPTKIQNYVTKVFIYFIKIFNIRQNLLDDYIYITA